MTPGARAKQIEQATLRAAQRARRRHPESPVTREELLQLRIQAAPPWQRVACAGGGCALLAMGIGLVATGTTPLGGVLVGLVGLGLLLLGLVGRRRTVQAVIEGLGDGLGEAVLELVVRALD